MLKLLVDEPEQATPPQVDFGNTGAESGMVRFFINIGHNQGIWLADIVRSITEKAGIADGVIGKIGIFDKFTFVEALNDEAVVVANDMRSSNIRRREINIEPVRRGEGECMVVEVQKGKGRKGAGHDGYVT